MYLSFIQHLELLKPELLLLLFFIKKMVHSLPVVNTIFDFLVCKDSIKYYVIFYSRLNFELLLLNYGSYLRLDSV